MDEIQKNRLRELKSKYYIKYVLVPELIKMSSSNPFSLELLKNASNNLRRL